MTGKRRYEKLTDTLSDRLRLAADRRPTMEHRLGPAETYMVAIKWLIAVGATPYIIHLLLDFKCDKVCRKSSVG